MHEREGDHRNFFKFSKKFSLSFDVNFGMFQFRIYKEASDSIHYLDLILNCKLKHSTNQCFCVSLPRKIKVKS